MKSDDNVCASRVLKTVIINLWFEKLLVHCEGDKNNFYELILYLKHVFLNSYVINSNINICLNC